MTKKQLIAGIKRHIAALERLKAMAGGDIDLLTGKLISPDTKPPNRRKSLHKRIQGA
jgi:hypothetical protein